MSGERFPKAKTIEKYFLDYERERVHAFRDVQIFSILETIFMKNNTNSLKLLYVKEKISEYKKIKSLLKKGLRNWIKDNNVSSIYYVIEKDGKDEKGNIIKEEYLIRNGNEYLNNLFNNLKKDVKLVPFPENPKILKSSFVVPFNWVFANENILYQESYESKEERTKFKLNIDYDQLTNSLIDFKDKQGLNEKEYIERIEYFNYIKKILKENGINNNIFFTGSSYTRLGLKNCDLDIYIQVNEENEIKNTTNIVGDIFKNLGMENVEVLTNTSIRLCKFYDPNTKFHVDISINNQPRLKNVDLFKIYNQLDERFQILSLAIKYFTKQRGIDKGDIFGRMINSYTYILLVIFFLQIQQPPVIPSGESLQEEVNYHYEHETLQAYPLLPISTKDIPKMWEEEGSSIRNRIKFSQTNNDQVGKLLIDFLEYYGFEFNYSEEVICPRKGQPLTKKEKGWEKSVMAIEDPLIHDRNKGGILFPWCFKGIINELKLAFIKLTVFKMDFLKEVCEPLKEIQYLPSIIYPPIDTNYKRKLLEDYVQTLK